MFAQRRCALSSTLAGRKVENTAVCMALVRHSETGEEVNYLFLAYAATFVVIRDASTETEVFVNRAISNFEQIALRHKLKGVTSDVILSNNRNLLVLEKKERRDAWADETKVQHLIQDLESTALKRHVLTAEGEDDVVDAVEEYETAGELVVPICVGFKERGRNGHVPHL
jgi:hypothetical protein